MRIRGTKDLFGQEYDLFQYIVQTFYSIAKKYDVKFLQTSSLESYDVIVRTSGADSDIVSKEMFFAKYLNDTSKIAGTDDASSEDKDYIVLKPEGTAPAIRALDDLHVQMQTPLRVGYMDRMFRYCRPQKGRLREFHQVGVEFFGEDYLIDLQNICMAVDFLQAIKLFDHLTLNINTVGGPESRALYAKELGIYFEKNKHLISYLHTNPLRTLDKLSDIEKVQMPDMPNIIDFISAEDKKYFDKITDGLDSIGVKYTINSSIVRGLDYYSHIVFEFTTKSNTAQNTVLAGGRYDHLIKQISQHQDMSAIGWGAGIERLMILCQECDVVPVTQTNNILLINLNCDIHCVHLLRTLQKHLTNSVNMISVSKLSKGLDIANKSGYTHVIICGENEMTSQQYTYKHMSQHIQRIFPIGELVEYIQALEM